jgi:hypothetical protein
MTDGSPQLLDVDAIRDKPKERTLKHLFGEIRDFDELTQRFTFYNPVTYHLVADIARTTMATDIVSHVLAPLLGEHPLVITDLPRAVFNHDPSILLTPEWKSFRHKLYAVPTEVWKQVRERHDLMTMFDPVSHRLCTLKPQTFRIPSPIGSHADVELPVELFTCYGNREIYCFREPSAFAKELRLPKLMFHPPVREFSMMADHVLASLRHARTLTESVLCEAVETLREEQARAALVSMQRTNNLHHKLATPFQESPIDAAHLAECRELIRQYEAVFGPAGSGTLS